MERNHSVQTDSRMSDGGSKVLRNVGILAHHYTMSQPRRSQADSFLAGQKIPRRLWDQNFRVHNVPPLGPILKQLNSVHILTFNTHFNIIFPFTSTSLR
jgi:hypothetical protein